MWIQNISLKWLAVLDLIQLIYCFANVSHFLSLLCFKLGIISIVINVNVAFELPYNLFIALET